MKKLFPTIALVLLVVVATAQGQTRNYSGAVKGYDGEALPGVIVSVRGTSTTSLTDSDGLFSISASPGSTIEVSQLGYTTRTIGLGENTQLDIILSVDVRSLEDVVVVGYQTIRKSHVTGAVSSVKSSELNLTTPSMGQALVGKVAGVQISQVGGAPYDNVKVRVRGTVSVNASSDPLYVIDGYPSNGDLSLNSEDIESIEILKDAASAAIYGSRASGGVVLITTKRGKDGRAKVDFSYQHTIGQLSKKVDLLNSEQWTDLFIDAHNNTYRDLMVNAGKPWDESYRKHTNAQRTENIGSNQSGANIPDWLYDFSSGTAKKQQYDTDWQDVLYRLAQGDRARLSISGGTTGIRYNVSGAYQNMQGIVSETGQKRLNLRSNIDIDVSRRFKIGANIALTTTDNREVQEGRFHLSPMLAALVYLPVFKAYNDDGTPAQYEMSSYSSQFAFQNDIENPLATVQKTKITREGVRGTYDVTGAYEFFDGFVAKLNLGMYTYNEKYDFYRPTTLTSGTNAPGSPQAINAANAIADFRRERNMLGEFTLNYKMDFGDHTVSAVAGGALQEDRLDRLRVRANGFEDDHIPEITGKGADPSYFQMQGETGKTNWSMASYFAQAHYGFRDRYFLSATFRGDASSRFGTLNRWGYFPSVSGGWTVSEENFWKDAFGNDTSLKLRASWGMSGNNNIGDYRHTQVMSTPVGVPNGSSSIITSVYPEAFRDPALGWESTSQLNVGFDLSLMGGRASIIANYYNSLTRDLLFDRPVSAISGSSFVLTNMADSKIRNRGFDIQVDGLLVNSRNFSLRMGGNISLNRNKVLDTGLAGTILSRGAERPYDTHITREGDPIGMFWGYKVTGMVRESDMAALAEDNKVYNSSTQSFPAGYKIQGPARSVSQTAMLMPGDLLFEDINGDGLVTEADKQIIGSPHPDFVYALNLSARLYNFDFSAAFNGVAGTSIIDGQDYYLYNMEGSGNNYASVDRRYRDEARPGAGVVYRASRGGTQSNSTRLSTFYLQPGSYFRCTNLTLGYTFGGIANATGGKVSSLRVYVAVDNAFTVSKFNGYNPEVDYSNGNNLTPGVNYGKYPLVRAYQAGAQLSF